MSYSFSNKQISEMFAEIEAALIAQNDDRFRIRAYQNAVAVFSQLQEPLDYLWKQKNITSIPGIGTTFAKKIDELFTTGTIKEFIDIKSTLPEGMFELLKVEGIGPKNAYKLASIFKLNKKETSITKLIEAGKAKKIRNIEGFGEKSELTIIENLERFKNKGVQTRILLYKADQIIQKISKHLNHPEILHYSPLGSQRRRKETVGDIDIGIATHNPALVAGHIEKISNLTKVISKGEGVMRIIWGEGINIDFKFVDPEEWGSLLQHFTGSKAHNVALRELAIKKKMSMSEHGMKINNKWHKFKSEEKFYNELGLYWIPPELRENMGEIQLAKNNKLPELIKIKDLKGDLHTHTNFQWVSSHDIGGSNVEQLVDTAIELGYKYIGIGDHNPSISSYSKNELIKQIQKRSTYIEQISSSYEKRVKKGTIKIYNSLEIDIRPNGELALPNEGIDLLDYAIVSIHSSFTKSMEETTERIIKGLSHKKAKILGHPTARLIGKREQIRANWELVFDFCKKHNKAIEINSSPSRLDLPDLLVKKAISMGVMLCINTDAHNYLQLSGIGSGVDVARRGWATKENIINSWNIKKFQNWLLKS